MIGGGVTIASGFVLGTTMAPSVVGTAAGTRMMIAGVTGTIHGWRQVIVGFSGGSMVEFPNTYTDMLLMPAWRNGRLLLDPTYRLLAGP